MTEVLFTLINHHGDAETGLTLLEAARAIIQHDGVDYELRAAREGFDLWTRQQVANRPWTRTDMFSLEQDEDAAEIDILTRFAADSRRHGGFSLMSDASFEAMQKETEE